MINRVALSAIHRSCLPMGLTRRTVLATSGRNSTAPAKFGLVDRARRDLSRNWHQTWGRRRPNVGRHRPHLDQSQTNSGRHRPDLGRFPPKLARRRKRLGLLTACGRAATALSRCCGPMGQSCPEFDHTWAAGKIGPNLANLGPAAVCNHPSGRGAVPHPRPNPAPGRSSPAQIWPEAARNWMSDVRV